jgi:hypothetical protein
MARIASYTAAPAYPIAACAPRRPDAAMIDAIVRHADLRTDMGSGRVLLRLSAGRLAQAEVIFALGGDLRRAGEIGVVWNEHDDEFVRVVDDARARPQALSWWEDYFDRYDLGEEVEQRRAA